MGLDKQNSEKIRLAVRSVKQRLLDILDQPFADDLAFIGNSSAVYDWKPSLMVDLDCFIFANELGLNLGNYLEMLKYELTQDLGLKGMTFDMRIIEGPFKPPIKELIEPTIVAHLGVFTKNKYLKSAPLKRWAWRKYQCEMSKDRLKDLAPIRPTLNEYIYGKKGLLERREAIKRGQVKMTEWVLPSLQPRSFFVSLEDLGFHECCFAYAANSARNHARALGFVEADSLGNEEYFDWYNQNVFYSEELAQLMRIKSECRDIGFDRDNSTLQTLTETYLNDLLLHLVSI